MIICYTIVFHNLIFFFTNFTFPFIQNNNDEDMWTSVLRHQLLRSGLKAGTLQKKEIYIQL